MRSQFFCFAVLLVSALALGGCAAALEGFPERVEDLDKELANLELFMNEDAIKKYESATGDTKKLLRDEYVNARITAINLHFGTFEKALFREGVGAGIGTDWIKLALGGAGALYAGASQALSAATAGIEGAKASFDKQAFFENTVTTLFAAMDANRKTVLVKIRQGLRQLVANYPLTQAMADLEDYYNAGTIPGALISINADSGAKAEKADAILFPKITKEAVTEAAFRDRVDLRQAIDGLDAAKAKALITKIENEFPSIIPFVAIQYPDDVRDADDDGSKAKKLLRRLIVLTAKEPEDRSKWKAAIVSL